MANAKCVFYLWLLILIRVNAAHNWTSSSNNHTLADVTLFIVREHLSNLTSTVVIAEHRISTDESIVSNEMLLDYILQNLHEKIAVQVYMDNYSKQPWEYYVFMVDSLRAFKEIYHSFSYDFYERHFRYLIVLTKYTQDMVIVMKAIFKLCYQYDVIDVNIITEHPTEGVCMFTYFHYSKTVCRGFIPMRLIKFNDGLENLKILFPEKLNNFYGCPLKVTSRHFPPFLDFYGNRSDPKPIGNWDNLSGFEGTLLKILAETLNFTIELLPFPVARTYMDTNYTYGCYTELKNGGVDVAVGGFSDSILVRQIFSPTTPYHNAPLMYVVRRKRNLSALARLAQPFSYQVWILVAFFIITTITFLTILKLTKRYIHDFVLGEENRNPITNFLALFLGYPVGQTPRKNFARYIFLQLLLLTLVLRNAYQGSLYDAIRMDRFVRTPSGYDDLIKWNYTIVLPPEIIYMNIYPKTQTQTVDSYGFEPRLKILQGLEGKYVTVTIYDGYVYYMEKAFKNGSDLLILLPEHIFNIPFAMVLPKHSIYLDVFDKKLKDLACAGVIEKITSYFSSNSYLIQKFREKPNTIALSNKRIHALYGIYAILITISVIVFGLELLSIKYQGLQRIFMRII